jgi:D-alanyl-D-alanine carboxypeptidase
MSKARAATTVTLNNEIDHYLESLALKDFLPINVGLHSSAEGTMISTLGSPIMPLTTTDQPDRVSPLVKQLRQTVKLSPNVVVTGIRPAIDSVKTILAEAFKQEKDSNHDLESVLASHDMLNVRLRKPTSGKPSTKISNHAWGTAIDFRIIGNSHPGDTGQSIPKFIAVLLPFFNAEGWFSGIGFHDTMHFEVADETIHQWLKDGRLKP